MAGFILGTLLSSESSLPYPGFAPLELIPEMSGTGFEIDPSAFVAGRRALFLSGRRCVGADGSFCYGDGAHKNDLATAAAIGVPLKTHDMKSPRKRPARKASAEAETPAAENRFPIVGIGASAGGLEALTELLKHLPVDTGMGFVIVQHLDPVHESALSMLLAKATAMPVRDVTQNLRVQPDTVYVIQPNTTLGIAGAVLKTTPREVVRSPHRSVDYFLEALAQDAKECAIGVILSGTASDGTVGLEAIKAEGGITFAQDSSARYDSMPRSAIAAGCVDRVLSPAAIARELARIARHPYVNGAAHKAGDEAAIEIDEDAAEPDSTAETQAERERAQAGEHQNDSSALPSGGTGSPTTGADKARSEAEDAGADRGNDSGFKRVLKLLHEHSGVDFSLYKSPTIQRRVARRLVLNKLDTLAAYAKFLRGNNDELDALYSDVLVSVTSFFRNPDAFEVLQSKIFPKLMEARGNDPLRVWTLGCSTGQEAYSIAMAFTECTDDQPRPRKLQVFATDLNNALIEKARHGLYAKTVADEISPERLRRFFVEEEGGYRVIKSLRESVVFARQNLIDDPPFSRMDLISCRNLLIYLEPSLQKKALPTFHYALKPDGFLFLGASESISGFTELFEPADRKQKIYSKKAAPSAGFHLPVRKPRGEQPAESRHALALSTLRPSEDFRGEHDAQREADRIVLHRFAPPSVLINADLQILQFRGATDAYLSAPSGKASFDLLKMAREGLMLPLRAAVQKALKTDQAVRKDNVRVEQGPASRLVNLEVIPLKNQRERCLLVVFENAEQAPRGRTDAPAREVEPSGKSARTVTVELRSLLREREAELSETRDYLQSIQEQHDAGTEELQAASEEVQSANEELQSVNEELETSKEELESSNEELTTINEEMNNRNLELGRANGDLVNLQAAAQLAILLLGRDLTIRRFSVQAEKHFKLLPGDRGRPIGNLRHSLKLDDLEGLVANVITSVRDTDLEVQDADGRWFSLRVRPYFTLEHKVDGAVLVLVDIDAQKRSASAITESLEYAEAIIRTVRDPLLILGGDLRVHRANAAFYRAFGLRPDEVEGHLVYRISERRLDIPELRELLEDILPKASVLEDYEISRNANSAGSFRLLLNARRLEEADGKTARILLSINDITERQRSQEVLRSAEQRHRRVLDSVPQKLFTATADGNIDYYNPAWIKYSGLTFEQLCGSGWMQIIHPDDLPENLRTWRRAMATGEPYVFAHRLRHVDGEYRWHLSHAQAVRDETGQVSMWAGSNNDLHEVAEAEHRKDEFLAMLAHELRGPLAPLSNALEIMRHVDVKQEVAQRASALALKQMQHMSRLIDDLLNVSRISSGRLELRRMPVDLVSVAQDAVDNCRSALIQAGHQLTLDLPNAPVYVDGDPVRLTQILSNLLNNACKYTNPPGLIHLCVDDHFGEARLSVTDNGIGIAAEQLGRIFDLFTQVDQSLARGQGGLGIGLSLVRSLVDLHGGKVDAHSAGLGQGSKFVVRLPGLVIATPRVAAPTAQVALPVTGERRILVVDDNHDTALSLGLLLQMDGNKTAVAHDGMEALAIGDRFVPDVVLLDIGLPLKSGYEVAAEIRLRPWGQQAMLIAVTGWGQEEDRKKSRAAGFDHHLVKPVNHAEIVALLTQGRGESEARKKTH